MATNSSGRIAKNTAVLYLRMVIVMIINLYAVRVLLKALGTEDYGIYNAIAGVVLLLNSVSGVLSSSIQRFYSYFQGKKDSSLVGEVYSSSVVIIITFSIIVLLISETVGLWFINAKLGVPAERLVAANWVFQFSVFSFIASIFVIPYSASVIAHEDMNVFAIISLLECVFKLLIAMALRFFLFDRLIVYGVLLLMVVTLNTVAYFVYCKIHYQEIRFKRISNKSLYKEILSFSGWTMFGTFANVFNIQGNTILVNMFFGPIVTAARAISIQISNALNAFCNSAVMALRPPMIKSYAENEFGYLMNIFYSSTKFIYYSMLMICLPLLYEMPLVLDIWLGDVSPNVIDFSRLIIIYSIILSLHYPITIIIQATGVVKKYFIFVEGFTLLSMPITYVLFKNGFSAVFTYWVMIIVFIAAHIIRLIILKSQIKEVSIKKYFFQFVFPAAIITCISFIIVGLVRSVMEESVIRFIIVLGASVVLGLLLVFLFGLSKEEKSFLKKYYIKILNRK